MLIHTVVIDISLISPDITSCQFSVKSALVHLNMMLETGASDPLRMDVAKIYLTPMMQ